MAHPPLCVLHIGKTGGSFLRSILRRNRGQAQADLQLLHHDATIPSTRELFGAERQLAFLIRDPVERFVSAFYSRLRQGRPTYQSGWSAEEAAAYLWFDSAEALALALGSSDERQKSAAIFAMEAIQHLAKGYAWYFGSAVDLLSEAEGGRIVMCSDISALDQRLPDIMARLGLPDYVMPKEPTRHENPNARPVLSDAARENLQAYWAQEFELYALARTIEKSQWS